MKQGEEDLREDLQLLPAHLAAKNDDSREDDQEVKKVYEWEDFFVD